MKQFVNEREAQLQQMKVEILERIKSGSAEIDEIITDRGPQDSIDIASDVIERNLLHTLGSIELNRLKSIDAAIARIHSGHYGNCVSCGQFLGKERLEAIPYAVLCVNCKNASRRG